MSHNENVAIRLPSPVAPQVQDCPATMDHSLISQVHDIDGPALAANSWQTLLRYARTVRHLKAVQVYTRLLPRGPSSIPLQVATLRPALGKWLQPISKNCAQTNRNRFRFLNVEREIASWNDKSLSKLWLYNLHYFEHVDDALVDRWIAENAVGRGIGWDPYPTSLRVANWCKWVLNGSAPKGSVRNSLAAQALWIEKHLERHLLANHLLANAKALLFAGCVLECSAAERWRKVALQILAEELPAQILPDGAHVERSPMYHSIVLEDLLDLCNLHRVFEDLLPDFSNHVGRMLRWLELMTHPDGQISFFNDAAFGVAPVPAALQAYAQRLGMSSSAVRLQESGYVRLENDQIVIIFDAAPLGPDYQPGHGHADALSFELSYRNRRILVNSGTSTYDPGPLRSFERGTSAHNTIRIDGVDQSEMWSAFRVARRAKPFDMKTDHRSFVEAAHDGYQRLRPTVTHRRRIALMDDIVTVTDYLEGSGQHSVELFYHLAPGADANIQFDARFNRSVIPSVHSTGFNQLVPNQTLVGRWFGQLPVHFQTRIGFSEV
jgi:Heparinase II/III-like protein/Heparinase II/III N-terminus